MGHEVVHPRVLYVGTPVYLVSTENDDGTFNLAPASSHFALGQILVLGLETDGQSAANLMERPELTVNFPSGALWEQVEKLAQVTGRNPVPAAKAERYQFEPRKFEYVGLTPQDSELVRPPRVLECDLQFEARARRITPGMDGDYQMVEADVLRVHAAPHLLVPGTEHIDPRRWEPLIYAFRHYFDKGAERGWRSDSSTAHL